MGILLNLQTVIETQAPPRHQRLRKRGRILATVFNRLFV